MKIILVIIFICLLPILSYFCVKFGTVAYYKAKEFIEEEKKNDNNNTL